MTGETQAARPLLAARTLSSKLIVVMRAERATDYAAVLETMVEAGVRSVELTLTTPGTFDEFPALRERFAEVCDLGIGTVTTVAEAERAVDVGADYIVTPITDLEVVEVAVRAGVPIVPGGFTPTELFGSWRAGASAVKIFPAGQTRPSLVKDLRGPFPDIQAIPSGGVDADGAAAWLAAGAAAVSVGGPLLGDAFRGGDRAALAERTRRFVDVCAGR